MAENKSPRVWVNRIVAFLAGGLVALAAMSIGIVTPVRSQNAALTKELDELQNGAARLLAEAKVSVANNAYTSALATLSTLSQKHPSSTQAAEAKLLSAQIESTVRERDLKWDAAAANVQAAWEKSKAAELRAQAELTRQAVEAGMAAALAGEWSRVKDSVREKWENGEV